MDLPTFVSTISGLLVDLEAGTITPTQFDDQCQAAFTDFFGTTLTVPGLAARLSTTQVNWQTFIAQYRDWLAGVAFGGPNSDGKYPMTDAYGNTYMVFCPAHVAATMAKGDTGSTALSISWSIVGKPLGGESWGTYIVDTPITLSQARSRAYAEVVGTASATFQIMKRSGSSGSWVQIGTVVFAAGATAGTVTITSTALVAGDAVKIVTPGTADLTLANISITASGDR